MSRLLAFGLGVSYTTYMDSLENKFTLEFQKLWSNKLSDSINCLAVGKPFLEELSEENDILIGTTAGRVLILNQTKVCFA